MDDHFTRCACFGHGLRLTWDDEDREFYLSLWGSRNAFRTSWKERLRHIWRILRTGVPWDDELVLSAVEAKRLAEFLRASIADPMPTSSPESTS